MIFARNFTKIKRKFKDRKRKFHLQLVEALGLLSYFNMLAIFSNIYIVERFSINFTSHLIRIHVIFFDLQQY